MSKLIYKAVFFAFCLSVFATNLYCQNPRAKERVNQVKKIKLLSLLDLEEQEAEKFLVKYSTWEKKIQAKKNEVDSKSKEIESLIKKETNNEQVFAKTKEMLTLHSQYNSAISDKYREFESMLSPLNFAKFVMFEERFSKELQRMLLREYDRDSKKDPNKNPKDRKKPEDRKKPKRK